MVAITFDNQNMILSIKGFHRLWTLKSALQIPLSHVQQARVNKGELSKPKGWRVLGTYIPNIITAGVFRSNGEKTFWDVTDKEKTIIIDLKDDIYKQIVVEVENPKISVEQINNKLH